MASASGRPPTLLRNTFFATLSATSAVFPLILLLAAGRVLGERDYGKFSFALALATIFENFMDFGLGQIVTRTVSRDHLSARRVVSNIIGLKLVLSAGTMVALVVVTRLLRPESDVRLACYLMGVSSMLRSYALTARQLLMGLERFGLESAIVTGDRLLMLGLGGWALFGGYGLTGLCVAFVVTRVLAAALAYALSVSQVGSLGLSVDLPYWRELQARAVPFGAFAIVLYLYNYIDTVMLGVLRTDAETGLYSVGYRLYEGMSSIASILYSVLLPRLSRQFEADPVRHQELARKGLWAAGALSLPVSVGAIVLAAPSVRLLFGPTFAESAGALQLLALGGPFAFLLMVLHAEAISTNAERLSLRTAVIGCVVNVGVNAVLIPLYGIYGAAVATVVGEGLSFIVLIVNLRRGAPAGARAA